METVLLISAGFVALIFSLPYLFKFALETNALQPANTQLALPDFMVKKHHNANIFQYESLFLKTGIAVAVLYFIIIFSLLFYTKKIELPVPGNGNLEEIDIIDAPVTYAEQKTPPPAIKPEMKSPEIKIILADKEAETSKEEKIITEEINEHKTVESNTRFVVPVEEEKINEAPVPIYVLTEKPEYPGGEKALLKFLAECPFSEVCKENDITGTVHIGFTISKTGEVKDLKVLRSPNKCFDATVLNHMKKMKVWIPGKQNGKPVNVTFQVPLQFTLNSGR